MHEPFKPVGYRPAPPPAPSRSRWRWVVGGLLGLMALLAVLVLIGPSLVDWNGWKGPLTEAVRRATGRELSIAGNLSLELLPRPRLVARTVSLGNALGSSEPEMIRVDRLEARLAPWPLLTGRFELRSLDLIKPTILLESLPDGTGNWESVIQHLSESRRQGALTLALEQVRIADGTAIWRSANAERKLERLEAGLTQSARGEVALAGSGRLGETPLRFESSFVATGEEAPLRILLAANEGEAEVNGVLRRAQPRSFAGRLRLATPSASKTLTSLSFAQEPIAAALDQPFSVETDVKMEAARLAASGLRMEFGGAVAAGKAEFDLDRRNAAVELSMSRLDLDAWPKDPSDAPWPLPALPASWSGTGKLAIEALVWQGGIISQIRSSARLEKGKIAVDDAKALLPGGSEVGVVAALQPADAGRWRWTGRVTAASDNLRGLLQWLGAEPAGVPADRLRKLNLKARLAGLGSNLQVNEIDATLDSSHVTGGVAVVLRSRPGFGVGLAIDEVNLDAYMPRDAAQGRDGEARPNPLGRFDSNFNLAIAELTYGGQRLQALRAEGTLQNGELALKQLSARTPSGGGARLAGRITGLAAEDPELDLDFDLTARDGAELVRLAGLPEPSANLGGMSLSGTAKGKAGAVAVDLALLAETFEAEGKLTGTVAALRPALLGSGKVQAELKEPARFARLLGIEPARLGALGPLSIGGEIGRDGRTLKADLTLRGSEPELTAELAGTRTGEGQDAALEGRFEASAQKGRPLLLALGFDPAAAPAGPVSASLTASGPLRDMAIEGSATAADLRLTLRGRIAAQEPRSYELAVGAEHPDLPRLASLFGIAAEPLAGALALGGNVRGTADRLSFAIESGRLGPLSTSGEGELAIGQPRPKLRLKLALGEAPLAVLAEPFRARERDVRVGAGWSARAVNWSVLTRFDAEAAITAEAASLGSVRIEDAEADLSLADGKLVLRQFEGEIANGRWAASGLLEPAGRDMASLSLSVRDAELAESGEWAGLELAGSHIDLGLELSSRGASAAELIQGFTGSGRIALEGGALRGVDLAALTELAKAETPPADNESVADALTKGETPLTKLESALTVERGVVTASDLAIVTPSATGQGSLALDLLGWKADGALKVTSVDRPDLPAVEVRVTGPLDAPRREVDGEDLVAALAPAPAPEPEPGPEPEPEPGPTPQLAPPPEPAGEPDVAAPAQPVQPPVQPDPAPEPTALQPVPEPASEPGTDSFVKGILEKLKKPAQP
jgi:uncharacterized protein involved in outer membrane biogenesis